MALQVLCIYIPYHVLNVSYQLIESATDYGAISGQMVQFNTGDSSQSLTISIVNDMICETPNENFYVNIALVNSTGRTTLSSSRARVTIGDQNEAECSEYFF